MSVDSEVPESSLSRDTKALKRASNRILIAFYGWIAACFFLVRTLMRNAKDLRNNGALKHGRMSFAFASVSVFCILARSAGVLKMVTQT
jgi:hypothetical protein